MHQINSNTVPTIFLKKFEKPTHSYPTNFARTNYVYHLLNEINRNTEFQSETQRRGKIFQQIQKKSNKRPITLKP